MIKLSESMWADAHKKNIGVEIRKEDASNLKDIKWIDFDDFFPYYVADRFYEKGGVNEFTYDMALKLFPEDKEIRMFTTTEFDLFSLRIRNGTVGGKMKVRSNNGSLILPCDDKGVVDFWGYNKEDNPLINGRQICCGFRDLDYAGVYFTKDDGVLPILLIKMK